MEAPNDNKRATDPPTWGPNLSEAPTRSYTKLNCDEENFQPNLVGNGMLVARDRDK